MKTPEAEGELLKKIEKLEAGHAHLKQEMSKLKLSQRRRSHSLSPQRSRLGASASASACNNRGFSSPLQRESRSHHHDDPQQHQNGGKYLNILQSIGHSVHILDLQCRIIYWLVSIFMFLPI